MDYDIMEKENLPEILQRKSKWMSFLVITSGILAMTACAVTIGTIFGYTYCYIEQRCIKPANHAQISSLQIIRPRKEPVEARYNGTINGGIMSGVLVPKIINISWPYALLNDSRAQVEPNGTGGRLTTELGSIMKVTDKAEDSLLQLNITVGGPILNNTFIIWRNYSGGYVIACISTTAIN